MGLTKPDILIGGSFYIGIDEFGDSFDLGCGPMDTETSAVIENLQASERALTEFIETADRYLSNYKGLTHKQSFDLEAALSESARLRQMLARVRFQLE